MAYYKDHNKKNAVPGQQQNQEVVRARIPRGREVLGIIEQRVGASRMIVKCLDGKERNCRVPGRLKRKLWLREGDVVIIEPWEYDDAKGEIFFKKYSPPEQRVKDKRQNKKK